MAEESTNPNEEAEGESVSRRDAMRALGIAGAAAVAGGIAGTASQAIAASRVDPTGRALRKPWVPGAERFATREERWRATSCACAAACGLRVRVVEGRAVRIEGHPDHPVNRGGIGVTALTEVERLYGPRRLRGPLARAGDTLVPEGWDTALGRLGTHLAEIRKRGAPEELVFISGRARSVERDLIARFCESFGTPNTVFLDDACSPLPQAMAETTGFAEEPAFDWSAAHYVLSLETGAFDDPCRATYLTRIVAEMRRDRPGTHATIVHASPTFDRSAHVADEWIRTRPGTAGALALGICHVLVREHLFDAGFIAGQTTGFDAFAKWVLDAHAPERAASIVGIDGQTIVRLARALALRRPAFVLGDARTFAFSNGRETALAVLAVNALLGAPGSLVRPESVPPLAVWPRLEPDETARAALARVRVDGARTDRFPRALSVPAALPERLLAKPPAVVVLDRVSLESLPRPSQWRRALTGAPFVVSTSPFEDESTRASHLVLPDHTLLEGWGATTSSVGLRAAIVGVRRPVVQALFDTRGTADVLLDVARRIGEPVAHALPWPSFRDALDTRLLGLHAQKRGSIVTDAATDFLHRLYDAGFWFDPAPDERPLASFAFVVAEPGAAFRGDEAAFPLVLLPDLRKPVADGPSWRRLIRARPRTTTSSLQASLHPESAQGVADGEAVMVETPFGAVSAAARLDRRMAPGVIALETNAPAMELFSAEPAPVTGVLPLAATRARIAKRAS